MEDLRYLRVHLDHNVLFISHFGMSLIYLMFHPSGELVLEYGGAHIGYPLLGCLGKLKLRLRQVLVYLRVIVVQILPDLLDSKAFISI